MVGLELEVLHPLLLGCLVPLVAGANPHIKHLSTQHRGLGCLEAEDHLEWSSVNAAHIRAETHELEELPGPIRALVRLLHGEPD